MRNSLVLHVKKACLRREERDKEDADALVCQHTCVVRIIYTGSYSEYAADVFRNYIFYND